MYNLLLSSFETLNDLLTAGIAITAFSLLIYALSFNLRDRVARSFALIMVCVVVVFVAESFANVASTPLQHELALRLQWVGIIFLPAAYLQLSDALLATTGRPSRGRRRWAVRLAYVASFIFLLMLPSFLLVGHLVPDANPAPHLQRTSFTLVFTIYYILLMTWSWVNFWRAYRRTVTSAGRRRMSYLLLGALAPALGSYPYLLFGSNFAAQNQLLFWTVLTISDILVSVLLVLMAYAVAFFGVAWPDRVVKRRLFKWLMRGPVTASLVLAVTTIIRRAEVTLGLPYSGLIPIAMVFTILLMEHLITLVSPLWERWLFYGKDRQDMVFLETLEERLLTLGDLRQFLEAILAALTDRLQLNRAFVAALGGQGLDFLVSIGGDTFISEENLNDNLLQVISKNGHSKGVFTWGQYWLVPIHDREENNESLLGLIGMQRKPDQLLEGEQLEAVELLTDRAAMALADRRRQQQALSSLEKITPQMDMVQKLRAASRYDGTGIFTTPTIDLEEDNFPKWVKDALTHYWGGPKLTENPLINLNVVRQTAQEKQETTTNALRYILRKGIENTRPDGDRRFTGEWILYNILEMKFLEGKRVREIAARLAMSEADLYRKQRVAIEAVADAVIEMEQEARKQALPLGEASN